jgi:hypothetical protein
MKEDVTLEQIDLYLSCLAQLANVKSTFVSFLSDEDTFSKLPECLAKCMSLCGTWHKFNRELILYSKIFSK